MSKVEERNEAAKNYVRDLIRAEIKTPIKVSKEDAKLVDLIKQIVNVEARGFRGVVLTAITAKYINPNFNPTKDFYSCNPRSIFEKGIRLALEEYSIPCGKSDPLNVAKNIQLLDMDWAKGKRPEQAAISVVHFLEIFQGEPAGSSKANRMIKLFIKELVKIRNKISNFKTCVPKQTTSLVQYAERLANFTYAAPEGGAIPQKVFGELLSELRKSQGGIYTVEGTNESVNGTNTTSKKAGDIWEEDANNTVIKIYEITVVRLRPKCTRIIASKCTGHSP